MQAGTLNLIFSLGNLVLLGVIAVYVHYLRKKEKSLEKEESRIRKEAEKVLNRAQEKAEDLVEEAVAKSQEVLSDTEVFKEDIEKNLRTIFEKAVDKSVGSLEKDATKLKALYEDSFQKVLEKGVNEEIEKVKQEVENYKTQQLQTVDSSISKIIAKVSQEVLGKVIPLSDHEDLVIEALERAKKDGLFTSS